MARITTRTAKGALISQSEDDANHNASSGNNVVAAVDILIGIAHQNDTIEMANADTATLDDISTITTAADTNDYKVTIFATHTNGCTVVVSGSDAFSDGTTSLALLEGECVTLQNDSTLAIWNIINTANATRLGGQPAGSYLRSDIANSATGVIDFINNIKFAGTKINATADEVNVLNNAGVGLAVGGKALIPSLALKLYGFLELGATTFFGNLTGNVTGNVTGDVTGNITGNAATVTTNANQTGDVTSVGNTTTISDNVVTFATHINNTPSNITLSGDEFTTSLVPIGVWNIGYGSGNFAIEYLTDNTTWSSDTASSNARQVVSDGVGVRVRHSSPGVTFVQLRKIFA